VARFGGDEFVVFQQNIHSHEDAAGWRGASSIV
jgi:PleD family two-component response regulator